jgi:hypothetical protein
MVVPTVKESLLYIGSLAHFFLSSQSTTQDTENFCFSSGKHEQLLRCLWHTLHGLKYWTMGGCVVPWQLHILFFISKVTQVCGYYHQSVLWSVWVSFFIISGSPSFVNFFIPCTLIDMSSLEHYCAKSCWWASPWSMQTCGNIITHTYRILGRQNDVIYGTFLVLN